MSLVDPVRSGYGPPRFDGSLWRLLVALVLSRVVRRRPRRSRASGRILLPCIHTVRKAALRCRFLVSPQWSACVRGQSSWFPFAVSYGLPPALSFARTFGTCRFSVLSG